MSLPASFYGWLPNTFPEASVYLAEAPIKSPHPTIIFNLINSSGIIKNGGGDGEAISTIQIDVYDPQFLIAHDIAKELESTFTAYQGAFGTQHITRSDASFIISKTPDPENIYRAMVSIDIRHKE